MPSRSDRRPRKPKVYRIPVETYVIALAIAFAFSVAFSLLSQPKHVRYLIPHFFSVEDDTFLPSAHALANPSMLEGNRVRVLVNGDEIFPAMLGAIRSEQHTPSGTSAYAISRYPDVPAINRRLHELVHSPLRALPKESLERYEAWYEQHAASSKALAAEAELYIPGGVQHNLALNEPWPLAVAASLALCAMLASGGPVAVARKVKVTVS